MRHPAAKYLPFLLPPPREIRGDRDVFRPSNKDKVRIAMAVNEDRLNYSARRTRHIEREESTAIDPASIRASINAAQVLHLRESPLRST